jgi:uncharacterized protein YjdB
MSLKKLTLAAAILSMTLPGCVITTTPIEGTGTQPGASTPPEATNNALANKAVRDVQVSQSSMVISVNKSTKVMATVRYVDGSSDGNVSLSSDDGTIVAINSTTGEINGLKPGTATVRAAAANDPSKFAVVQVTVREGEREDVFATITPEKANVAVRSTVQLSAEIQDSNAKVKSNGRWTSSNEQVASVSQAGIVTGLKDGVVTITFTSDEKATVKATAEITVGNPPAAAATTAPASTAPTATPAPAASATPSAAPSPSAEPTNETQSAN